MYYKQSEPILAPIMDCQYVEQTNNLEYVRADFSMCNTNNTSPRAWAPQKTGVCDTTLPTLARFPNNVGSIRHIHDEKCYNGRPKTIAGYNADGGKVTQKTIVEAHSKIHKDANCTKSAKDLDVADRNCRMLADQEKTSDGAMKLMMCEANDEYFKVKMEIDATYFSCYKVKHLQQQKASGALPTCFADKTADIRSPDLKYLSEHPQDITCTVQGAPQTPAPTTAGVSPSQITIETMLYIFKDENCTVPNVAGSDYCQSATKLANTLVGNGNLVNCQFRGNFDGTARTAVSTRWRGTTRTVGSCDDYRNSVGKIAGKCVKDCGDVKIGCSGMDGYVLAYGGTCRVGEFKNTYDYEWQLGAGRNGVSSLGIFTKDYQLTVWSDKNCTQDYDITKKGPLCAWVLKEANRQGTLLGYPFDTADLRKCNVKRINDDTIMTVEIVYYRPPLSYLGKADQPGLTGKCDVSEKLPEEKYRTCFNDTSTFQGIPTSIGVSSMRIPSTIDCRDNAPQGARIVVTRSFTYFGGPTCQATPDFRHLNHTTACDYFQDQFMAVTKTTAARYLDCKPLVGQNSIGDGITVNIEYPQDVMTCAMV